MSSFLQKRATTSSSCDASTKRSKPVWGDRCVDSVLASVTKLAHTSGIHSRRQRYRRMIDHTFHLGIYYRERDDDVLVAAVLDLRRDPRWIQNQLR